jgi:transposase
VIEKGVSTQHQEELPVPRAVVRTFRVHVGRCQGCARRVQGRHPLQTSDALGGAAAQLWHQRQLINVHALLVSMLHARDPTIPSDFQATTVN